ncbi:hypothetical protein [Adhaeretor mobilis]|nr:hypothetical protein [Adhaeretor mobilis]
MERHAKRTSLVDDGPPFESVAGVSVESDLNDATFGHAKDATF